MGTHHTFIYLLSIVAALGVHSAAFSMLLPNSSATDRINPKGDYASTIFSVHYVPSGGRTKNTVVSAPNTTHASQKIQAPKPVVKRQEAKQQEAKQVVKPLPTPPDSPAALPQAVESAPNLAPSVVQQAEPDFDSSSEVVVMTAESAGHSKQGNNDRQDGATKSANLASGDDIPEQFTRELLQRLAAHKHYPFKAQLAGIEGIGRVYFEVAADGSLIAYRISESTGSAQLDKAIAHIFKTAFPLPRQIASLGPIQGAAFNLPIAYSLNH